VTVLEEIPEASKEHVESETRHRKFYKQEDLHPSQYENKDTFERLDNLLKSSTKASNFGLKLEVRSSESKPSIAKQPEGKYDPIMERHYNRLSEFGVKLGKEQMYPYADSNNNSVHGE